MQPALKSRRYPIGAELIGPGRTSFRVWAPAAKRVDVAIQPAGQPDGPLRFVPLTPEGNGYFSGEAAAGAGALYRFQLDGNEHSHPDPATRCQPLGPHGQSCIVDPAAFPWTDRSWLGLPLKGQVIYELHIGTFTPAGTWPAAARELPELAALGVTVIEMMPIAEFAGQRGWGYDGVNLFAPFHVYGSPDDLRAFIDQAHAAGLAVILDVVYNHLGPEGNYLQVYAPDYFTDRYETDWGQPLNFDGPNAGPVREFFVTNACYWIEEFHFDGFRFDATQNIYDASPAYILGVVTQAAGAAAGARELIFIAENEPQETKLVRPYAQGGDGLHGLWNDDFHHTAAVALTGRTEAYYTDYGGTPQEFISAAKYGYLYQGQPYAWQGQQRGTPSFGLPPEAFVAFIENHDQVANTGDGRRIRLHTSPGRYRAMTALLLLGPWTPLLFQGQEFGASADFLYFNDITRDLHAAVRQGRADFLKQFPSYASPETQSQLADPFAPATFARCQLDFAERARHAGLYALHRDLLKLRRTESAFAAQTAGGVDGAVLGPESFVLRFFGAERGGGDDRLLIVNFGRAQQLAAAPEPLLAPPHLCEWTTLWSSELPLYGGPGPVALETTAGWRLPAEAATVLLSRPAFQKASGHAQAKKK